MASPEFDSPKEFRTVMDAIFTMMSDDPEMGPSCATPTSRRSSSSTTST